MRNKNTVKINFIRHGKTELNERHCYIGTTDSPLSQNGVTELKDRKNKSIYPKSDIVFISPLLRCLETASIIFGDINFIKVDEFKEMDFGSFEGKSYDELKDNLLYRKWIDESRGATKNELDDLYGDLLELNDENIVLPEDKSSFIQRSIIGFEKVLYKLSNMKDIENEISVVAHGGTIMAITSTYIEGDYYKYMLSCGDGIKTEVTYTEENGNIEISYFSVNNWIRA